MKYLKKFFEWNSHPTIWESDLGRYLPNEFVVIKGDTTDTEGYMIDQKGKYLTDDKGQKILMKYKRGNLMKNPTEQITYERDFDVLGIPDTLEFDISMKTESDGKFSMIIEIIYGELITTGFKIISPNQVLEPFEYTSYHSIQDPSNTVFAFNEKGIKDLIEFINTIDGFDIKREHLHFLDAKDSYDPHH
jgi:hypothetical protein